MISSLPSKALRKLVDITRLAERWRIIGECLLITSLPGTALRTLVDIARLAEPSNLDIKSRAPGILFTCISLLSSFTLQTNEYDIMIDFLCRFSVIGDVVKKSSVIMT